jgi:hypothetical protein
MVMERSSWSIAARALLPAALFAAGDCVSFDLAAPPPCKVPADCRAVPITSGCAAGTTYDAIGPCATASCDNGTCKGIPLPDGPAPPDQQVKGDCNTLVCSGGNAVKVPANDPPLSSTTVGLCQVFFCTSGKVDQQTAEDGTGCSNSVGGGTRVCSNGTCVQVPTGLPPGAGMGGADGGSGTGGSSGAGGDGGIDGGAGGSAGTSTGGSCAACEDVLSTGDPSMLCGMSAELYDALASCICGSGCGGRCGANLCQQEPPSADCIECMASWWGCSGPLLACNGV